MALDGEVKNTLAALLNVDFSIRDISFLFLSAISACQLHIWIQEGYKASQKPDYMEKSKWDRCCKDMWRLTNHTYMCLASFVVLYRHNLLDMVI